MGAIFGSKINVFGIVFAEILKTYDFRNIAPRVHESHVFEDYGVKIRSKMEAKRKEETGSETGGFWGRSAGPGCGPKIRLRLRRVVLARFFGPPGYH